MLSAHNLYVIGAAGGLFLVAAVAAHAWRLALFVLPTATPGIAAALAARRWRLSDLGAGEELRRHELARRWVWQPRASLPAGERRYIGAQGEIVRVRPWPDRVDFVPMTADGDVRLPIGEGHHIFECGGTGTGKTTTARRPLVARTLAHGAAALLIDQKGDPEDERELRKLAAAGGRPFILFDPRDSERSDRWAPLWGEPGAVAARAVEAIKTSEPYYADVLRQHLNLIVAVLHAAGRWPPSFPFLVEAASAGGYNTVEELARGLDPERYRSLQRRVHDHGEWVGSREGIKDLRGGLIRLEVVMGAAWREVLTPRPTEEGETVAVRLVEAIRQGAVVMWRTYADDMPDEAAAITVLALSDLHAAAGRAGAPWTLMLDEFGAVIHMAAARGVSILQRARSHGGQVIVISQSAADIEALSQQPGLLPSLSDNFTAFVAHRQTAPETRDWLAKLMGTRSLWQSTDQTRGHGASLSGAGSRRRVREFRVGSDEFATLGRGEAVIYTTLGPEPERACVVPARLPDAEPERITRPHRHRCEIAVYPEQELAILPAQAAPPQPVTFGDAPDLDDM
ncbi:MAG: TraM recognition domain-containing protein [Steroidobacteraceae bacterium]